MPRKKPEKSKAKPPTKGKKSSALTPEVLGPEEVETRRGQPKSARPLFDDEDLEDTALDESTDNDSDDSDDDGPPEADDSEENRHELMPAAAGNLEPEMRAVSPTDPLRRYLEEVRKHPLLTPEEEIALVTRMHSQGDVDAAKRLVQANLRLVVKIAFEYRSVYTNVMDLIQEGNIGLMKAVSKFDPTKGARLGYYSSWWIRSYILKYLLDNFRLVRVGTTQAQKKLFFHLMREKERLEAQGLLAAPKLLAEKLDVREKDVVEMEQRLSSAGGEVSLDSPMKPGGENRGTFVELLSAEGASADDQLAQEELLQLLESHLPEFEKGLNDKEKRILKDRMLAEEPKTLQEVADLYGLTRERARQIEAKVLEKLREFLTPYLQ